MGETVSEADKRVAQMLADKGWTVTPPAAETWVPAFKPTFYREGGDEEGQVYLRIDLPEGLYYALQDAARFGLQAAQARHARLQEIERAVEEAEREPPARFGEKRSAMGMLDGIQLTSGEVRGAASFVNANIHRYQKALDRADTRRDKA